MYLLSLSHFDKKPQCKSTQEPSTYLLTSSRPLGQVWPMSSSGVTSDKDHQRCINLLSVLKKLLKACLVFTVVSSGGRGRKLATKEGGMEREGGEGKERRKRGGKEERRKKGEREEKID